MIEQVDKDVGIAVERFIHIQITNCVCNLLEKNAKNLYLLYFLKGKQRYLKFILKQYCNVTNDFYIHRFFNVPFIRSLYF